MSIYHISFAIKTFSGLLALIFLPLISQAAQPVIVAKSGMYAARSFKDAKHNFSPLDKIHVAIELANLAPGEYHLTTDWITPLGNLEQQSTHTFYIKQKTPSRLIFSWLKLHGKGSLKRVLTGSEFKEEFYGEWKVRMFLNGTDIFTTKFNVQ